MLKQQEIRNLLSKKANYFSNTKDVFFINLHNEVGYNYLRQNILNILDDKEIDKSLDHLLFKEEDDYK